MTEELKNSQELKVLFDIIQQVLDIEDSAFNEVTAQKICDAIKESDTQASIAQSAADIKRANVTVAEYEQAMEILAQQFDGYVESLDCIDLKKKVVSTVIDFFFESMKRISFAMTYDIKLPIILMNEDAKLPTYAHSSDTGADIYAHSMQRIPAHSLGNKVPTGLKIALPEGWEMQIRMRSSMAMKTGLRLSNSVATIDQDYRGEIILLFDNLSDEDYTIMQGDRIAQFVLNKTYHFYPETVETFETQTERAEGGFGSSGK